MASVAVLPCTFTHEGEGHEPARRRRSCGVNGGPRVLPGLQTYRGRRQGSPSPVTALFMCSTTARLRGA